MAETTTISVSESTLDRFKSVKSDLNDAQDSVPDHNADSFLNALLDTWEAAQDGYYDSGRILPEDAVKELIEEFAVAVEPEQGMVDDSDLAREVAAKIDYAELATRTADELEGRLRR